MSAMPLQHQVIEVVRKRVDVWRGFSLGAAKDAYPDGAPRYQPTSDGEREVTPTTLCLLQHWFRQEPHILGQEPNTRTFKYWPHQRRLVETFIYLHEVVGVRRSEDIYKFAGVEPMGPQRDPWTKLGGQLATGSGKTKIMSLIIAWSYLNAVCEPLNPLGLGRHTILIAPGLFVKDRLLQDFFPPVQEASVFMADPVIPPEFEKVWELKVYDPRTCPLHLDPNEGALVVTNFHQLLRSREDLDRLPASEQERQIEILFGDPEPEKLEAIKSPLIDRFSKSTGILVLNDEAHHVWDEPGHAQFEEKAKQKKGAASEDEAEAMAWIRCIRKLNGGANAPGRVGLQVDLSATLFQETGTTTQAKKKTKKGMPEVQFKANELFRHTVVTYDLDEAIRDGIVKKPILEKVEVRKKKSGEPLPLIQQAAPNAWQKYEYLLVTGVERWKKVRDQLRAEGDTRKPILFILCADKSEAAEVTNFLKYGEATSEDLEGKTVKGFREPGGETLFVEKGKDGLPTSTVIQIHIGQKENSNEEEWGKVRDLVNAIDRDEIPDFDEHGNREMLPNPYNVVVSVLMLKEGWDVRNVKVVVPLRPCGSRTLTLQTLGRGLRKMHAPNIEDDGSATMTPEELFVIEHPSFQEILSQIKDIVEEKTSDEISHPPDYVAVPQVEDQKAREGAEVRLVRVGEPRAGAKEWRGELDVAKLPALAPRLPWMTEIDRTVIKTWLKAALQSDETEGQEFTMPSEPSYQDFDHVIELAYAKPLLHELKVGFQHKNAVKDVVRQFLERKTFNLPAGIPVRFDEVKDPADATIALGNLSNNAVCEAVRGALLQPIHDAIQKSLRASKAEISERRGSQIGGYQALKTGVIEGLKKSPFARLAGANGEEQRLAALLEDARDVKGWVFNHRQGVGYSIPYDWQGHTAHYFPDFIVRARIGLVFHNFIIEVKGRLEEKDKVKAERGRRWCETLTENDSEPWHFLMLVENDELGRKDISWWQSRAAHNIEDLLRRHEGLPLIPEQGGPKRGVEVLAVIAAEEQFKSALPVFDLETVSAKWGTGQKPDALGWVRYSRKDLDDEMFVAQVRGNSMEPGIPEGAWGLFRCFSPETPPGPRSLDGRRILSQVSSDPPAQHSLSFARWRVGKLNPAGDVEEIALQPDNGGREVRRLKASGAMVKAVAEFLETLG